MTGRRPKGSIWVLPVPVSFRFVQCLPRCSAWVLPLDPTQNPVELTLRVGSTPTSGTIFIGLIATAQSRDLSHSAFSEESGDVVVAEAGGGAERHELLDERVILSRSGPRTIGAPASAPQQRNRRRRLLGAEQLYRIQP